jgi:hypothetical protein
MFVIWQNHHAKEAADRDVPLFSEYSHVFVLMFDQASVAVACILIVHLKYALLCVVPA